MQKPILVIMAAGIGSRFGGLKQLAPVGINGEPIIEFSLYDAIDAGFEKVIFIIKEEIDQDFKELIGNKIKDSISVEYVHQSLEQLPSGFSVPDDRIKPWGTGHAVLQAKNVINAPFAVINADDYYGKDAFSVIFNYLNNRKVDRIPYPFAMVGYQIENTLTDYGHVARGVCKIRNNHLEGVDERLRIEKHRDLIEYTEDEGVTWHSIERGTTVSMNLWGFTQEFLTELEIRFPGFLDQALKEDPTKREFLLPTIVNDLLKEEKATVEVLRSKDQWYGVTYREDLAYVATAIQNMQKQGLYPKR